MPPKFRSDRREELAQSLLPGFVREGEPLQRLLGLLGRDVARLLDERADLPEVKRDQRLDESLGGQAAAVVAGGGLLDDPDPGFVGEAESSGAVGRALYRRE